MNDWDFQFIFVGGPGRSGTSYLAAALTVDPRIAGFYDVELKYFNEVDGLIDLYNSACRYFTPNRLELSAWRFEQLFSKLCNEVEEQASLLQHISQEQLDGLIRGFLGEVKERGAAGRLSDAAFFSAARDFSYKMARLGRPAHNAEYEGEPPAILRFVEKTPHVLLELPFLDKMHPGAKAIHVMRDPRGVAASLARMEWGPSTLEDAIRWVRSYWSAYEEARSYANLAGRPPLELFVEEIVADVPRATRQISAHIGLDLNPAGLFVGNTERINSWVYSTSPEHREMLDDGLGVLAERIGYRVERPGERHV